MISWNRKILFYPFNPFLYPSVFVFFLRIKFLYFRNQNSNSLSLNYFLTRIEDVEEPSKMKLASINVKGDVSRYKLT